MTSKSLAYALSAVIALNPLLLSAAQSPNIIRLGAPVNSQTVPGENWVDADPIYSSWASTTPYACSTWAPDPASFSQTTEFEQASNDCLVDSSRTRQDREVEETSGAYRNKGEPVLEEVTYTSQSATRDYRITYSAWSDDGEAYGCSNWTPDPSTYALGSPFTQSASDCSLDQQQTRSEFSRFDSTDWVSEASESFSRTLTTQSSTRQATGSAELPIIALNAPATQVFAGEPLDLSWTSTNSETVSLRADNVNAGIAVSDFTVTGNNYEVTPAIAGTFTYTATAVNSAGQASTSSQTVSALNGPSISSFSADKTSVAAGGTVTFTWAATNTDTLSIDNGIGDVTGTSATVEVSGQSGVLTYTLTGGKSLNGIEKTAESSVQVEVVADPSLSIVSAPATSVFSNAPFTLTWSGTDVESYSIRGNIAASGVSTTDVNLNSLTSRSITPTAAGTYTYTLTATNGVGETKSITQAVTVVANPAITSLTSTSAAITSGGSTTLNWVTTGSGTLSLDQGVGAVTGSSKLVSVGTTLGNKTYTLTTTRTLNGVTRTANQSVIVDVVSAPTVTINAAPATSVFANAPFSLGWSSTGATNYKIKGSASTSGLATTDIDLAAATSREITPTAVGTYTYTVTATNAAGATTTATASVTVVADPVVSAFTASPATVTAGGQTLLSWTTSGASSLGINQSVGAVTGTSKEVEVGTNTGTKTYTLTASNTLNGVSRSATLTSSVTIVPAPTITLENAPSTDVFANVAFTISWTATSAVNYKIRGNSTASGVSVTNIDLGGTKTRNITPTTPGAYTYTITATNAAGATTTATASVTVVADPVVSAFTASPATVTVGGNTTLAWTSTGSTFSIDQGVGAVTGTSKVVAVGTVAGSKVYTITTSSTLNGITRSGTRAVTVSVAATPTVLISTAPATNVFANAAFTLGWTATGATNYKIKGTLAASGIATADVDLGTATSRAITPTAAGTYTYSVTATNAAGATSTAIRSITVVADPVVSAFTASPATVTVGGNTTLAWTGTGSTFSIDQGVGAVTGTSKVVAVGTVAGSKVYTLTTSSTLNGVTRIGIRPVIVTVADVPTVTINAAPATSVFANTAFNLGWSATGATNYKIKGSAAASGLATTDTNLLMSTSTAITPTAAGTYTYTVTATNAAGATTTATASVTVVADPVVSAFTASPATVTAGGNTTLAWTSTGSTFSIDQGVGAVTGTSKAVAVGTTAGSKTYTLTASNTLNGVTRTGTRAVTVAVVAAPTVTIGTKPSTSVFASAAFTLGWSATGATNYKIKGSAATSGLATTDLDLATATSRAITPTAAGTYTYTVTATNAAGATTTATASVTVVANPVVSSLTASSTSIAAGGTTTLTWASTGASTFSIDQGVGAVTGTSKVVSVGAVAGSKIFTLTASSTLNGVTRTGTRTVTVTVVAAPTVTVNSAPATNVFISAPFTLGWTGTNITSYAIKGNVAASGVATTNVAKGTTASHSITPTAAGTYTYTITATNSVGVTATTTRSVTVAANPVISSLTASPTSVSAGGTTTLTWASTGGSTFSIDQGVGAVTGTSKAVAVGTTAGIKTYSLTASTTLNGVTRSSTSSITINITPAIACRYDTTNKWVVGAPMPSQPTIIRAMLYWDNVLIGSITPTLTSHTVGGYTYTRGATVQTNWYQICRQ